MVKAVIYARYSCELQREESIDGQVRECLAFAKSKGYEIIDQYIDRAISAKTDDRPSFQKMIRDGTEHKFEAIIVWKVDRFARNRLDALQYKSILRKAHVKVVSATENISDGPEGILLESVLDGLAEYYSADLAQKVKRGMTENVLEGEITGGRIPFGYKKEGQKYVIDSQKASIVREMFNQYANTTITCKGLARYINSKGFLNGNGKSFRDASIYNMLRNEKYTGVLRFGETVNKKGTPPIVDEMTFKIVQEKMAHRKNHSSCFRAKNAYLLSGKVFCGDCGSNWVGVSSRKKEYFYNWYRCKEYLNHQKCKVPGIKSTLLEEIVIDATCNFLKSKMSMDMMAKSIYEEQGKKSPLLRSMESDYMDVSEKMKNILSAIEKGADFSILQERYKALEANKKALETNIALENSKNIKYSPEEIANGLASITANDFQSEKDKRDLIDTFINSVFVYPDGKVILLFSNNPHLAPVRKDEMEKMEVEKTNNSDYLEYVKGTGIFGISFKPKSLRFATQAKSKKRSIYMNSTERYNMDLQRILKILNGIQPYNKDTDLKKRGKRLVEEEMSTLLENHRAALDSIRMQAR